MARQAWRGEAWRGQAWYGKTRQARRVEAWQGMARLRMARQAGLGMAWLGKPGFGKAGIYGEASPPRTHNTERQKSMATTASINVPAPNLQTATFRLEGTTSLICHAWSDKAKQMMLDKQMKRASGGKQAKDPEQDFRDSLYPMPDGDGYGFPALAFKAAMVRAGTLADLKMTVLRLVMHVPDGLVRIEGSPEPREDMVRLQGNTADIRYRGEFMPWAVELPVTFNANVISHEQIANLLMLAGFSVGVGEWRPERDGNHGMWRVV